MAKIEEASEDVVKIFDEIRDNSTIPQWVEFKVLCNDKQKELCKLVRSNQIVELLSEGVNFAVVINESILVGLPLDMQKLAIDECLAGVGVSDTDTLSSEKPNFNTHTGVLKKYGHDKIITLKESIKSLYDVQKQKEDEAKAQKKAKKTKKSAE